MTEISHAAAGTSCRIVGVHILNAPYQIDKEYDYELPQNTVDSIGIGSIVVVPFGGGNRYVLAVVSSFKDETDVKMLKPVTGVPIEGLSIGEELYGLCEFMKERVFCSIGEAAKTVLPSGLSVKTNVYYTVGNRRDSVKLNAETAKIVDYIAAKEKATEAEIKAEFGKAASCLARLVRMEVLERTSDINCRLNTKSDRYVRLLLGSEELSERLESHRSGFTRKQLDALYFLIKNPFSPLSELTEYASVGESVVRELVKKEAVEIVPIPTDRNPYMNVEKSHADFSLSPEQQAAFDTLLELYKDKEPRAALLFGVTGSGKTNVIQKLCDKALEDGKGVIILVPEIALTSQAVGIFAGRYGEKVAVLHSGLSAGERLDAWRRISSGDASVVLGTRSAIFAPVKELGLIVIDEEQESSFKSDMTPRYHARDIARYRCAKTGAMMLLSSATPSIESYYKAKEGVYTLVTMKNRYSKNGLPDVEICDMRDDTGIPNTADGSEVAQRLVGTRLHTELKENLEKGEQSVLFINRRGYRAFISCRKCGYVMKCPHCSVSMTYHKYGYAGGRMKCHYCGYETAVPTVCPECGSEHISSMGTGTQMLEEQLGQYFPEARLLRMDTDTTSGKLGHDAILESFRKHEADILLGTQMVTKGHDFGAVSLVGVLNADTSLYIPDYRANERTFALLTQVIGRAGRAERPGRAIIQSYSPEHEVIQKAKTQDYEKFYESEIRFRKAAKYPPFCDIMKISFSSEIENDAIKSASRFAARLDEERSGAFSDAKLLVFGPFAAGVYKVAGRYRINIVVKCGNTRRTRELFAALYTEFLLGVSGDVSISMDMNPLSL